MFIEISTSERFYEPVTNDKVGKDIKGVYSRLINTDDIKQVVPVEKETDFKVLSTSFKEGTKCLIKMETEILYCTETYSEIKKKLGVK
jgi:hypothetical protein